MTEEVLQDSPYAYNENLSFSVDLSRENIKADFQKLFKDHTYGKVEYLIMYSLYTYPFLNKHNISVLLDDRLKEKKWKDYSNVLKQLVRDGVLYTVSYGNLHLYCLSEHARDYIHNKQARKEEKLPANEINTKILEYAALAQWHISLTRDSRCKASGFYKNIKLGNQKILIPSYAEVRIGHRNYRVLSYGIPKGTEDISELLDNIEKAWTGCNQIVRKNTITVTVLVVSSLLEAKSMAKIIKTWENSKGRTLYYALEANCIEFEGLSCLYYFDYNSDNQDNLKTVNII